MKAEQTGKFSSQISQAWLAQIIRPFLRHPSETWLKEAAAECAWTILFNLDNEPEDGPDWADLREMARNAGWTPDTWMARDVHWGQRDPARSLRTDLGWVSSRHFQGHHRVELHGPEPRPIRTVALIDPTPSEVLAAARLVGLGGAS
jgi:hypothetical protein